MNNKEKILTIFVQYMEIARDPEISRSSILSGFESELDEILNSQESEDGNCETCVFQGWESLEKYKKESSPRECPYCGYCGG